MPFCLYFHSGVGVQSSVHQRGQNDLYKPFQCEICFKRFGLKGNYIMHQRIHTGEKPYSCSICHKRFNRKGNMETHKMTHLSSEDLQEHAKLLGNIF